MTYNYTTAAVKTAAISFCILLPVQLPATPEYCLPDSLQQFLQPSLLQP